MPDAVTHPTTEELAAFGLGKASADSGRTIAAHLALCDACRQAVAALPPDSFVAKVRSAKPGATSLPPGGLDAAASRIASGEAFPATPKDLPPELVNHSKYRIMRELGRGGMGVVYQARQTTMNNRQVVIKVINRALLEQPGTLERFRREIAAAAELAHPNIVTAFDSEQVGDLHMLVMEFVPGQSLAEVLAQKGPLSVARACHYIRQVALGLQHASDRGMVHRDIKPGNLMVMPKGQVKILDFGLAKVVSERRTGKGITSSDAYMGTPDYSAPEQATDARKADIRADLYSLGCTLYALLAGRPPFEEDTAIKTILAHMEKQPRPLPELRPGVPDGLWRVVAKLLAKDPAHRYQKPIEIVHALAPFAKVGAKPETKTTTVVAPVPRLPSVDKATRIATPSSQVLRILHPAPGEEPGRKMADVREKSPFADLTAPSRAGTASANIAKSPVPAPLAWYRRPPILAVMSVLAAALFGLGLWGWVIIRDKNGKEVARVEIPPGGSAEFRPDGPSEPKTGNVVLGGQGKKDPSVRKKENKETSAPEAALAVQEGGFVPLFNGTDLTGWCTGRNPGGRVKGGILTCNIGFLASQRDDYSNFHLQVESRIGGGAYAHIRIRGTFPPIWGPNWDGYAIVLNSTNGNPVKTGGLLTTDTSLVPFSTSLVPPNEWFRLEVIAVGARIIIKVNGQTTADYTAPERRFISGRVFLLPVTGQVDFRKVEIKRLK